MTAFLALSRQWRMILGLALVGILSANLVHRSHQRDEARTALAQERQERALLIAHTNARSEELARRFSESARRIERDQAKITEEIASEYQDRIRELNRRAAALRLRASSPTAGSPVDAGADPMSHLPGAASGADGASSDHRLSLEERVIATEQAIRLEELQKWASRLAR